MDRLWGLTSDNIEGLEIVTAAGEIVTADAATNADLYWACRGGGGGNFGIVTEFRFSPFPVTATALFFATWPWEAARQLLPAWLEWAPSGPDALWSNCVFEADPGTANPYVQVAGVWAGSQAGAQAQLDRLIAAAGPPDVYKRQSHKGSLLPGRVEGLPSLNGHARPIAFGDAHGWAPRGRLARHYPKELRGYPFHRGP